MAKPKRIVIKSVEERDNLARAIQAFDKEHGINPFRSPRLAKTGWRITGAMSTSEAICRAFNGDEEELSVQTIAERVAERKGVTVSPEKVQNVLSELRDRKKIQRVGLNRYRKLPVQ
jgi:hypothetical protein